MAPIYRDIEKRQWQREGHRRSFAIANRSENGAHRTAKTLGKGSDARMVGRE